MVRIAKQKERRARSPRRRKNPSVKTGPVQDNLSEGYKPHANALAGEVAQLAFIPKIK